MHIALIACSKTKADHPCAARDMYQGTLFKRSVQYAAEVLKVDEWYILSAKHELLHPNTVIEPYNVSLYDMDVYARRDWGYLVNEALRDKYGSPLPFDAYFTILAGKIYHEDIERYLGPWTYVPMRGLGIGQQLHWLKREIDGHTA